MAKERVLVVHPHLRVHGGGEGVCAWVLQALRDRYDVTFLTWMDPDLAAVNRFYGTSLAAGDFALRVLLAEWPDLVRDPSKLARLHYWSLAAIARKQDADLLFAVDDECDLGGRGVQYVHYPRAAYLEPRRQKRPWWHTRLIESYYGTIALLTGTRNERIADNVTLVNSDWTGRLFRRLYGTSPKTVHPPAAGTFADVPWAQRRDEFVAVGRLVAEKRYPLLVEIVERLRARGAETGLTIVGAPGEEEAAAELESLARTRPWLTLRRNLSREALSRLLSETRYGLHGLAAEHFGMAVAEMVLAGQVPFTPDSGGQIEIADDERLFWADADEAVAKIMRVRDDAELRADVRARLAGRREHLAPERFVREIRDVTRVALISAAKK